MSDLLLNVGSDISKHNETQKAHVSVLTSLGDNGHRQLSLHKLTDDNYNVDNPSYSRKIFELSSNQLESRKEKPPELSPTPPGITPCNPPPVTVSADCTETMKTSTDSTVAVEDSTSCSVVQSSRARLKHSPESVDQRSIDERVLDILRRMTGHEVELDTKKDIQVSVSSCDLSPKRPARSPSRSRLSTSASGGRGLASPTLPIDSSNGPRRCSCLRSCCLKLYCECFAAGQLCEDCLCSNCHNTQEHADRRSRAIGMIVRRNPDAFNSKIESSQENKSVHTRGCNCKKSWCLKNYCECYEARVLCSSRCRCRNCLNGCTIDSNESSTPLKVTSRRPTRKNLLPHQTTIGLTSNPITTNMPVNNGLAVSRITSSPGLDMTQPILSVSQTACILPGTSTLTTNSGFSSSPFNNVQSPFSNSSVSSVGVCKVEPTDLDTNSASVSDGFPQSSGESAISQSELITTLPNNTRSSKPMFPLAPSLSSASPSGVKPFNCTTMFDPNILATNLSLLYSQTNVPIPIGLDEGSNKQTGLITPLNPSLLIIPEALSATSSSSIHSSSSIYYDANSDMSAIAPNTASTAGLFSISNPIFNVPPPSSQTAMKNIAPPPPLPPLSAQLPVELPTDHIISTLISALINNLNTAKSVNQPETNQLFPSNEPSVIEQAVHLSPTFPLASALLSQPALLQSLSLLIGTLPKPSDDIKPNIPCPPHTDMELDPNPTSLPINLTTTEPRFNTGLPVTTLQDLLNSDNLIGQQIQPCFPSTQSIVQPTCNGSNFLLDGASSVTDDSTSISSPLTMSTATTNTSLFQSKTTATIMESRSESSSAISSVLTIGSLDNPTVNHVHNHQPTEACKSCSDHIGRLSNAVRQLRHQVLVLGRSFRRERHLRAMQKRKMDRHRHHLQSNRFS